MRFKIISIVLSASAFLIFSVCSDFLKEEPLDQLPEDEAYDSSVNVYLNTVATLYNYVGGYEDSQGLMGTCRGIYDLNTLTTDEAMLPTRGGDWYDGGLWQGLFLHKWGVNNDVIEATWEYLYKVIVLSNRSLEKIEEVKASADNPIDFMPYIAEVRAFRAMYYYYLLDMFGRVPLVLSSSTPMKDVRQSERSEVFEFVVDELQDALPYLSSAHSNLKGDYYGRMTKPVAYFLLAKLFLNVEIYTDDDWTNQIRPDGSAYWLLAGDEKVNAWQAVVAYCDSIAQSGYRLSDKMADNFTVYNETSVENIFTIPTDKYAIQNQMQYTFRSRHYNHAKAYGLSGENGTCATIETLKTFAYDTDSCDNRFEESFYAGFLLDFNGDTIRLDNGDALIYLPWNVGLDISFQPYEKTAGARMKKYEVDRKGLKDGKLSDNDIVLFRYADVLLMKSEAKVRNGENGDVELNEVRRRSGMPERSATLENILEERKLELVWEGWRRQDMVRFGIFTKAYTDRPQLPMEEETGYTTVFPIPLKVISLNSKLKQNPYYE